MAGFDSYRERVPLTTIGGIPIYAVTLIAAALATSLVVCSLLMAANVDVSTLAFDSAAIRHGQLWRIFTYPLLNYPSFSTVIDIFLCYWFGRELEYFFGRRAFVKLYGILLLAPIPVLLAFPHATMAGARSANFAIFIAFAVLYPRAQILFGIEARWVALVYLTINVLQALAEHAWMWISPMLLCAAAAFIVVRHEQGRWSVKLPKRQPKLVVLEGGAAPASAPTNVDAILEKISRGGMQSLTQDERSQLEKAREHLLRK